MTISQKDSDTYRIWGTGFWVASALFVLDLVTKWLAVVLTGNEDRWIITPRLNPELALGVLTLDMHPAVIILLIAVTLGILVHSLLLVQRHQSPAWPPLLMLSGVLANAIDRLVTGAVHDWLHLGPVVANVADFVLLAGLLGYAVYGWRAAEQA